VTTFLFTDIESSTRRWESDPEGMAADLARHDRLLKRAMESVGGKVFGHTGDGMVAAFSDPGAALEAAVGGQLAVAAAAWSGASPLRVRMGVHTGPAQRRAANFFGPTLNRTARMMAVGSGGQVLCSQATAELAAGKLPAGVGLLDLGEHRLADLAQPERVFQVVHPDLESTFPRLRSLGAHRHNLPVALTSFVGRTGEVKELEDLIDRNRLITLTGVGGAGKTRLALQVAAGCIERYPDGVWLIELARIRDGALVAPAVAAALGVDIMGMTTADAVEAHLSAHLAAKRALLLFDNCEHLLDTSARFIHQLLTRCSALTVVATTRENLGLPGEVTWRVLPLSLPAANSRDVAQLLDSDAALFFWERARVARPGFELNPANATDVARICRRLEGIPLALELAAARVRVLSVQEIAERLDDCFQLLTGAANIAATPSNAAGGPGLELRPAAGCGANRPAPARGVPDLLPTRCRRSGDARGGGTRAHHCGRVRSDRPDCAVGRPVPGGCLRRGRRAPALPVARTRAAVRPRTPGDGWRGGRRAATPP
jgi:class 3 adenylate cyclase